MWQRGHDERRQLQAPHVLALVVGAWQHDGVLVVVAAEPAQHLREQRVRLAVIQRDIGWRPDHDHDPARIHPQPIEDPGVRFEIS